MPENLSPKVFTSQKKGKRQFPPKTEFPSAQSPWPEEPEEEAEEFSADSFLGKLLKRIIIGLLAALAIGAVVLGYYFSRPESPNISLEFSNLPQVLVGQPFDLGISLSNYSDKIIEDAKLAIILPEGVSFTGQPPAQRVIEETIGDIGPGSLNKRTFNLIVLSGSNSLKRVEAKLSYKTSNSPAQFEGSSAVDISVGQAVLALAIESPEKVFSGENFELTVKYENNSAADIKNVHLKIDYPPIFKFQKASPAPDKGNNYWNIGALPKGEGGSITILGSVIGPADYHFGFTGTASADFLGQNYSLASQSAELSILVSPLSLAILVNNTPEHTAHIGETLRYLLQYKNNSNTPMENVVIRATFLGELFDFSTARSQGFFDSVTNTFLWNAANTPELALVEAGGGGAVEAMIKLKDAFLIRRLSDKNYVLKAQGQIESPTVPEGTVAEKTISLISLETKVSGLINIKAAGYFRDAASGILNSGQYPPRVNTPTEYSIHWRIANYSTEVSDVKISANLQSNSRFTGKVKSNIDSVPKYNPASGEITWQIPKIAAGRGVITEPVEAVFQIENTPAINQVGQNITLLGETKIEAHDDFTDTLLFQTAPAITTALPDDPTIGNIDKGVQP
jgi:hypothetical protein